MHGPASNFHPAASRTFALILTIFCLATAAAAAAGSEPADARAPQPDDDQQRPSAMAQLGVTDGKPFLAGIRVDRAARRVYFDAEVCLRQGDWLELLVCMPNTREHESILRTRVRPAYIHAAMLLIGAKPGQPLDVVQQGDRVVVRPPTGPAVRVMLLHRPPTDDQAESDNPTPASPRDPSNQAHTIAGNRPLPPAPPANPAPPTRKDPGAVTKDRIQQLIAAVDDADRPKPPSPPTVGPGVIISPAAEWILNQKTRKPLDANTWLFVGSTWERIDDTDRERYLAETAGNVISLVNFGDEVLARQTTITRENDEQMFTARTSRIPAIGQPVVVCIEYTPAPAPDQPQASPNQSNQPDKPRSPARRGDQR